MIDDPTPESVQVLLSQTNRGLMLARDEIAGLFEFGRYSQSNKGGAAARAWLLETYEGGSYKVTRLTRNNLVITCNALTIFGNIQPARLAEFDGLERDGLIQRFNTVRPVKASVSRSDIQVRGSLDRINEVIRRLVAMNADPAERYDTTPDGAELIREAETFGARTGDFPIFGERFQGFCSKLHGFHARYALLLHLIDNPASLTIPTETMSAPTSWFAGSYCRARSSSSGCCRARRQSGFATSPGGY